MVNGFRAGRRVSLFLARASGQVLGEDLAAGTRDCLVASRFRLSQQSFELGEDLLDGVEVGGVFRQKTRRAPISRIAFRPALS
jgi:hypothetical protein